MISIVYFSLTGERKSKFTSVAGPALLRHIALSASSFKRPGLPMAPPLGELSAEQTERALVASRAGQRELCLSYLLRGLLHMLMHPAALKGGNAGAALLQDLIVRHEL